MMLYLRVILVLFISLLVSTSPYANEQNLVVNLVDNGGFESGVVTPWVIWGAGGSVVISPTHSGDYAGYLAGQGAFEQMLTGLAPNTTYQLRGWARFENGSTGQLLVGVKNYGGPEIQLPISGTDYVEQATYFTTGTSSSSATIFCFKYGGTGGAYCDDFSVEIVEDPPPPNEWALIWSDEFDGNSLDTAKWGYEIGHIRNNELQYYTNSEQNVRVGSGNLVLEAHEEPFMGYAYTSGSIETKGNFSFAYGRVDVRAAVPMGQGLWPAIWTLGDNIDTVGWPSSGEIDIMEHINNELLTYGTFHYEDENGEHVFHGVSASVTDPSVFHVYTIEWDTTEIRWYVDDQQFYQADITSLMMSEFHLPHHLKLNLAVGGNWPGAPDETTSFPAQYLVDYVRVYEPDTSTILNISTIMNGVQLSWLHSNAHSNNVNYELWRDTNPYFDPNNNGSILANFSAPSPGTTLTHDDTAGIVGENYFYLVRGIKQNQQSSDSNQVGVFHFDIQS